MLFLTCLPSGRRHVHTGQPVKKCATSLSRPGRADARNALRRAEASGALDAALEDSFLMRHALAWNGCVVVRARRRTVDARRGRGERSFLGGGGLKASENIRPYARDVTRSPSSSSLGSPATSPSHHDAVALVVVGERREGLFLDAAAST